ncbi:MAG: hypothetical protein ACI8RZ_001556 [Myxococcota bacterium]|jgi:hypothetical protein
MSSLFRTPTTPAQHRYMVHLRQGDPPADAVAAALMAGSVSHEAVEAMLHGGPAPGVLADYRDVLTPPLWVDEKRQRIGCAALQRTGLLGGLVLSLYCLPLGYLSPAGVKPLVLSGRLLERAARRLSETNRFLMAVTRPGGMVPGSEGFCITGRVRIMHAVMRLRLADRWDDAWGTPINQAHMAATNLLFSWHAIDGLRKLGVRFSAAEVDGYLHLWRHVGYTMGVDSDLLCATEADARGLWRIVRSMEGAPDAHCRELAAALVGAAVPRGLTAFTGRDFSEPRLVSALFRLSTVLLGAEQARALGYEAQPRALVMGPLVRGLVGGVEAVRLGVPGAEAAFLAAGARMNRRLEVAALEGRKAEFVA